nr:flagellar basal body M-ring protein FliF [Thiomonas arsenitoxydans]
EAARAATATGGTQASSAPGAGADQLAGGMPGALAPDTVHLSNTLESDAAISRELVKQDPRRAAQVVKEWLSDGQ